MAGEDQDQAQKTEEPTPKRLEDAYKKGDVARSQEVKHLFMILAATLAITLFAGHTMSRLQSDLRVFLESPHLVLVGPGNMRALIQAVGHDVFAALLLPLILFVIAAIAGNMIQNKPVLTFEKMKPKPEKISVLKGLKRMFSIETAAEFAKNLLKLLIVSAVVLILIWPERARLEQLVTYEAAGLVRLIDGLVTRMLIGVVSILAVIAGADYLFQRFQHHKKQRMTKQEVKDEHKQLEGDPAVKARLRQIRMDRARKRMMAAVPEADVVITNPTHFAVALKYDADAMEAPKLVAKGLDKIARRIRDLAEENDVPIVENPPLARALYATVEVDEQIPPEHYKAVAEIIGYIMRLRNKMAGRRPA